MEFDLSETKEATIENTLTVKIVSSSYKTKKGFAFKRELIILKRQSIGPILDSFNEDLSNECELENRIVNFLDVEDGVYN